MGEEQAGLAVGKVVRERRQAAGGIAGGGLDLQDVGAEVGEELGAERAGHAGGEVEDAQPVECGAGHRGSCRTGRRGLTGRGKSLR